MYKRWREWASDRLDSIGSVGLLSALLIIFIYVWHLGEKTLSTAEGLYSSSLSLDAIRHNPINAPHDLLFLGIRYLNLDGVASQRFASVICALIIIGCFYLVLKYWLGRFGAWLGALLFSFTPFLMLAGRTATANLMVLFPIVTVAAYMWLIRNKKVTVVNMMVLVVAAALSIYEPGGVIVLLLGAIRERHNLSRLFTAASNSSLVINSLLFIALLVPLILAIATKVNLAKSLILLPASWPSLAIILKSIGWGVLSLFWHSSTHHVLQVGQLAIFDGVEIILALFGAYALWEKARNKLYPLVFLVVAAVVVSAINQNYDLLLFCLPPIIMVSATGLRYLYVEWSRVFPRNPLPRGLATFVLILLIATHIVWGAHYALTAWPHSLPVR